MQLPRTLVSRTGPASWRIGFILIFLAFVPVEARGPLDRERALAGVRLYYAPQTNLADIDRALMASARERIDLAAYVLTDQSIIYALMEAARRGVKLRVYLDPDQPAFKNPDRLSPLWRLLNTPGVQTRVKQGSHDLMHLKAYQIDGRVLRTGSANFSFSGARRQDNDLIVIESTDAVSQFMQHFDYMWTRRGSDPILQRAER